jgi:glutamate formiminotransferase
VIECVVNVSEGRDHGVLQALTAACGSSLLDVHADGDHNRAVFTLAGPEPEAAVDAVRHLARAVAERVSIVDHIGVHPWFGALDVVPFVALPGTEAARTDAAAHAHAFARWWSETYQVPVFCYDDADALDRDLPHARRHAFRGRSPDYGPATPDPTLGATAVGARGVLVAVNCKLATADIETARRIAGQVRERAGGLPGVRALGFRLASNDRTQVSMNLVDLPRTGIEAACTRVRELASASGTDVVAVELVGLLPRAELDRCSDDFVAWSGLRPEATIEARLERNAPGPGR